VLEKTAETLYKPIENTPDGLTTSW